MYQQPSDLDGCLSELQAQIDGLGVEPRLPRQADEHVQPTERQLSQLTDQYAAILDRWATTGEHHARVVRELEARLGDWHEVEGRLQQDTAQRLQDLERAMSREGDSLRRLHEEPVRQLREQATALADVCVAAAGSAQSTLERAEARLALLEADLHRRMNDLGKTVSVAVAELRSPGERLPLAATSVLPRPLETGTSLHDQPRGSAEIGTLVRGDQPTVGEDPRLGHPLSVRPPLPDASALSVRVGALERALADEQAAISQTAERTSRAARAGRVAVALLAMGVVGAGGLTLRLQQQVGAADVRLAEADRQARVVIDAAAQPGAPAREDAARELNEARAAAVEAQIISDVLAAPDLVRYFLTPGASAGRASAQLLWSRSRGVVLSASGLAPTPENSTYQVWLLTRADAVSAGTFVPDASGRVTVANDQPPVVPRPVIGVSVTLEPAGGRERPSGTTVLVRAPR